MDGLGLGGGEGMDVQSVYLGLNIIALKAGSPGG